MSKSRKLWLNLSAIFIFVFGLISVGIGALVHMTLNGIMTDGPELMMKYLVLLNTGLIDLFPASWEFLTDWGFVLLFSIIGALLIAFSGMIWSRFKNKHAKFVLAEIFAVVVMGGVVAMMFLATVKDPNAEEETLAIIIFAFLCLLVLLTLSFAIVAGAKKLKPVEASEEVAVQDTVAISEQPVVPMAPVEVQADYVQTATVQEVFFSNTQPTQPMETVQPTVPVQPVEPVQPVQQPTYTPMVPTQPVQQPTYTPVVPPQPVASVQPAIVDEPRPINIDDLESVAEIVARVYGGEQYIDEKTQVKLNKLEKMYALGYINKHEFQQLTVALVEKTK